MKRGIATELDCESFFFVSYSTLYLISLNCLSGIVFHFTIKISFTGGLQALKYETATFIASVCYTKRALAKLFSFVWRCVVFTLFYILFQCINFVANKF